MKADLNDFVNVNELIYECHTSWNSQIKDAIYYGYSKDTRELVEMIYKEVDSYFVDWTKNTLMDGIKLVEQHLINKYPYLSEKSVSILCNYYGYICK